MRKEKKVKIIVAVAGLLLLAAILVFLFAGDNIEVFKAFFRKGITQEEIRANAQRFGWRGVVSIGLLSMLQVVFMFLPAEPVQVIAGVSYGLWFGILVCEIGVLVGNTLIYIAYKIFGSRLSEYYSKKIDIDWNSAKTTRSVSFLVLILYILPAIPYGMICFFAAGMGLKYPRYILLTGLGALPSVLIGVGLGHLAITASLIWAAAVFVVLLAILLVLFLKRNALAAKLNAYLKRRATPYTSDYELRDTHKLLFRLFFFLAGVYVRVNFKVKYKNLVGKLNRPSIVLVNHGTFVDFLFSGKRLKKYYPNIVCARMYFYHKTMGTLMKMGGVIPKSMFTADLESAKNCVRAIKQRKGMLLMMPEARLSTVGRYEGIQNATAKFIYKSGVDVYLFKIHGNYFARPKWGNGPRRRSPVECTLGRLCSAEELSSMDYKTFNDKLDRAMDYDEYEWLAARPKVKYRNKRLAEGLEGILYKCPCCGAEGAGETRKRTLRCTVCGNEVHLDDRYAFREGRFKDLRDWYDWQQEVLDKEIEENEDYRLESKVELKHASKDGKTCLRHAGEGVCRLDRCGLTYEGTDDGETVSVHFNGNQVYRLLFGVNEDFELYVGKEIYYFVPENKRLCVKWYQCSIALKEYFKE